VREIKWVNDTERGGTKEALGGNEGGGRVVGSGGG